MFTSKTAFLLDALEYYTTNPNRRCTSKLGRCMYNPKTANKKISEGCLIGRHLTTEQQDKGDDIGSIDFIFNEELEDEILPKWMLKFERDFLSQCQNFHDDNDNWNRKGLSKIGRMELERIVKSFELDKSKFTKYL